MSVPLVLSKIISKKPHTGESAQTLILLVFRHTAHYPNPHFNPFYLFCKRIFSFYRERRRFYFVFCVVFVYHALELLCAYNSIFCFTIQYLSVTLFMVIYCQMQKSYISNRIYFQNIGTAVYTCVIFDIFTRQKYADQSIFCITILYQNE